MRPYIICEISIGLRLAEPGITAGWLGQGLEF